jgi:hypothetical protein
VHELLAAAVVAGQQAVAWLTVMFSGALSTAADGDSKSSDRLAVRIVAQTCPWPGAPLLVGAM